jgi:hypothetical protein
MVGGLLSLTVQHCPPKGLSRSYACHCGYFCLGCGHKIIAGLENRWVETQWRIPSPGLSAVARLIFEGDESFFLGHGFLCVDIHQLLLDIIMIIKDTNHYHDYCYDYYKHYYDYHSYYYWCSRSIIISMILPNAEAWSLPLGVGGEKRPQRPQKALFGCSVWGWWLNRKKGGKTKGIHWYL